MAPVYLLTDPFLQNPTDTTVQVVWFTEFAGLKHEVRYHEGLKQTVVAITTQLSRVREDQHSKVTTQEQLPANYQKPRRRMIWRHEATVSGLIPGQRFPYQVVSVREDNAVVTSDIFTLAAQPLTTQPLKILLTSDHQLKAMVAANLQKVLETVEQVDAIFFAGDLVNTPDRASEWFDDNRGNAFFPSLQGRANYELHQTRYVGGALIQSAPLYPAIGNHEVMGRFSMESSLDEQFTDSFPRQIAAQHYQNKFGGIPDAMWLKDYSFNTDTYEEIFSLPQHTSGTKQYYAVTFGSVRLIALYITNMWRSPILTEAVKGRYSERQQDLRSPQQWGYGQLIFGEIHQGSPQYCWLQQELQSSEFREARYKVVMFHHPPHSLGENIVPPYAEPQQIIQHDPQGKIQSIRYEYPHSEDIILRDVIPLLESAGVQLVLYGHSHLWNRFVSSTGMHFLETSNVGNSFGAYVGNQHRNVPADRLTSYATTGDPNGLEPVIPTIAPLLDETGQPMPYIASNEITVFSIFETVTGKVSSYRFDTRQPSSGVIKFDEFLLKSATT